MAVLVHSADRPLATCTADRRRAGDTGRATEIGGPTKGALVPASDMFRLSEDIRGEDYLLATYYIEMPAEADILAKAASYAVGQTIGTWVEVPGVTAEMRDRHLGRVVKVLEAPPVDLGTQAGETSGYFMQIALPTRELRPVDPDAARDGDRQRRLDVGAGQARRPRGARHAGRGAGRPAVRDRGRAQARRGAGPARSCST